jgi:hypothetical protein
MRILSRQRTVRSLAVLGVATVLVGAGVFIGVGVAAAAQNTVRAGTVLSTTVVTESVPSVYSNTGNWQTLVTTSALKGGSDLLIRWSASSRCRGMAVGWCSARVLVNGTPAQPDNGLLMPFDYTKYPREGYEYLSMEKVAPAGKGDASVEVQINPTQDADTVWDLAGWTLTIEVLA